MSSSKDNAASSNCKSTVIKEIYCVEYPGKVVNVDRAIDTLGGIENISNAFSDDRKLQLRYQPDNKFCMPVDGEIEPTTSLLFKVVKHKKKNGDKPTFTSEVVGKVTKTCRFTNLADHQFLPIEKGEDGKPKSVLEHIVPHRVENESWLREEAPEFLIPPFFSLTDTTLSYLPSGKTADTDGNVGGSSTRPRRTYVYCITDNIENVPTKPHPATMNFLKRNLITDEEILKMKEFLDGQPVWTRIALGYVSKFSRSKLKRLLSFLCYYFVSGPFSGCWVKFGYDPRKDPSAIQYQTIDYRMRTSILTALSKEYPDLYSAGYRKKLENVDDGVSSLDETCYIFRPGCIPPLKQMYYQAGNIKIAEVEEKLRQCAESPKYSKYGWFSKNVSNFIREQINKHIVEVLQQKIPDFSDSLELLSQGKNTLIDDDTSSENDSIYSSLDEDEMIHEEVE